MTRQVLNYLLRIPFKKISKSFDEEFEKIESKLVFRVLLNLIVKLELLNKFLQISIAPDIEVATKSSSPIFLRMPDPNLPRIYFPSMVIVGVRQVNALIMVLYPENG